MRNATNWTICVSSRESFYMGRRTIPEVARRLGIRHVLEVECDRLRTPFLNDLFAEAQYKFNR
jgi:hypothetical protein